MAEILTRCGYRCDLYLAFRPNVETTPANQHILSEGWFQYFGFRIPPEQIICDGCMSVNPQLIDRACPVRPCVIERALENCAPCPDYGCEKLSQRIVVYEDIADRIGIPIPQEDRARFIAPYENKQRFEVIRSQNR